jgi:hypothetical protein
MVCPQLIFAINSKFGFSHLINKVFSGTIDTQLISSVKRILHPSGVPRGVLLAFHAARAVGANVAHIKVFEWTDPNKKVCSPRFRTSLCAYYFPQVRMLHELIWSVVEVSSLILSKIHGEFTLTIGMRTEMCTANP